MLQKYFGFIIGFLVFIGYQFTIAPTIAGGDSAELAIVQATLGIAHPTGYPLYTLLGHLFYLMPLPYTAIFKLNLLSSIYCSISTVFIAYSIKLVLVNSKFGNLLKSEDTDSKKSFDKFKDAAIIIASAFGALLWSFSFLVWYNSTSPEVYSLHIAILSAVVYFGIKAYYNQSSGNSEVLTWLLVAFFMALAFSNHLTSIYIIPGILLLLYLKHGFSRLSFKILLYSALLISVVVVIFYSYLLIRSNQQPFMNWGDPSNLSLLIYHISGSKYHHLLNLDIDTTLLNLNNLVKTLFNPDLWEIHIGIIFSLIGSFFLFKVNRRLFAFFLTSIITTILISTNYEIPDINTYFFLIYICLIIFAAAGLYAFSIIISKKISPLITLPLVGAVILILEVNQNFDRVNYKDYYIYEDYTKEVMKSVEDNSVIIVNEYAPFLFPSYYYMLIEGLRKDVTVVCLTMDFDWYKNSMHKLYPDILDTERNQFNFNPDDRPVYVYSQLINGLNLPLGYQFVPDLYLFKIENNSDYHDLITEKVEIRANSRTSTDDFDLLQDNICKMVENRALYEFQSNNIDRCTALIKEIKSKFPTYTLSRDWDSILSDMGTY